MYSTNTTTACELYGSADQTVRQLYRINHNYFWRSPTSQALFWHELDLSYFRIWTLAICLKCLLISMRRHQFMWSWSHQNRVYIIESHYMIYKYCNQCSQFREVCNRWIKCIGRNYFWPIPLQPKRCCRYYLRRETRSGWRAIMF